MVCAANPAGSRLRARRGERSAPSLSRRSDGSGRTQGATEHPVGAQRQAGRGRGQASRVAPDRRQLTVRCPWRLVSSDPAGEHGLGMHSRTAPPAPGDGKANRSDARARERRGWKRSRARAEFPEKPKPSGRCVRRSAPDPRWKALWKLSGQSGHHRAGRRGTELKSISKSLNI